MYSQCKHLEEAVFQPRGKAPLKVREPYSNEKQDNGKLLSCFQSLGWKENGRRGRSTKARTIEEAI